MELSLLSLVFHPAGNQNSHDSSPLSRGTSSLGLPSQRKMVYRGDLPSSGPEKAKARSREAASCWETAISPPNHLACLRFSGFNFRSVTVNYRSHMISKVSCPGRQMCKSIFHSHPHPPEAQAPNALWRKLCQPHRHTDTE